MTYLLVFFGGGLGAATRHGVNVLATRAIGSGLPFGTVVVNVAGSLAMGLFVGWFATRGNALVTWRPFAVTGFLGGFTTFSAFSLDAVGLFEREGLMAAAGYVAGSVGLSIAALVLGLALARL